MTQRRNWQRLPGGRYRSQVRHPVTGERLSITADSLGELEQRRQRITRARSELRYGLVSPDEVARALRGHSGSVATVAALWARYAPTVPDRSRAVARSTYERRVAPYLGDLAVTELTEPKLRSWQAELERGGFASKTREGAYYCLAGLVRLAISDGTLQAYPWGGYRPPAGRVEAPREALASLAELERLVAAASARGGDLAARVVVLALTGIRQAEAAALGWDDVDLEAGVLVVRYQAARGWWTRSPSRPRDPTKTRSTRTQRLHPSVARVLTAQRDALAAAGAYREDGPVFPADASGRWRRQAVLVRPVELRRLVVAADLPNPHRWTTHSLRHSFATLEILANGGDLRAAQGRTGHASLAQLEGYVHAGGRGLMPSAIPELSTPLQLPEPPPRRLPPAPESALPWSDLAARWLADGRSGRPPEVEDALKRAYRRAWRAGGGAGSAAAAAAGRRARKAALGAWGRALAAAKRQQ